MLTSAAMWGFLLPGHMELVILAFILLILFGNRLPSVMRSLGSGIVEFKKGLQGVDDMPEDGTKEARKSDFDDPPRHTIPS